MVALLGGAPLLGVQAATGLRMDVGFDDGSFPLQYGLGDGSAAGLYPAIVSSVGQRLGWQLQLLARPFKRLLSDLMQGEACGGALVRTPEREAYALFSQAYYVERLLVFALRGRVRPFRTMADLAGYRVGVIRGWSYGAEFDAARQQRLFETEEVANDRQNFVKLFRERIDYVVATELGGRLIVPSAPADLPVQESERPVAETPIHFAMRRSLPQAAEAIAAFNGALRELQREGAILRLVEREMLASAR